MKRPFSTTCFRLSLLLCTTGWLLSCDSGGPSPTLNPAEPGPQSDAPPDGSTAISSLAGVSADVVSRIQASGEAQVIITLALADGSDSDPTGSERQARVARTQESVIAHLTLQDFKRGRRYSHLPLLAGTLTMNGLARLQQLPGVIGVELDLPMKAQLAESVPIIRADLVRTVLNYTGRNVRVAVLDTGIAAQLPDLANSVVAQQCFTQGSCPPSNTTTGSLATDQNGHGTGVSAIITADGVVSARGVAPDSRIVAVRVLDANGSGFVTDWIAGLNWIVANQSTLQVRVVNMSIGTSTLFSGTCDTASPAATTAINQLVGLGISVFAASGNAGSATSMSLPACVSGAIAVGATYDFSSTRVPVSGTYSDATGGVFPPCFDTNVTSLSVACFTNSSAKLELVAPGILTTTIGLTGVLGATLGTSNASPMAAGTAALMLEANPGLTPANIRSVLASTGTLATDQHSGGRTTPRIDAYAAVLAAQCIGRANGTACNDGNLCTQTDTCQSGTCVGSNPVTCTAGTCQNPGTCNPSTGQCSAPTNRPDGTTCSDGNACTQSDSCQAGTCVGSNPVTCTAPDACHSAGTCNPATGVCGTPPNRPDGTACNDGNACTQSDSCQAGTCVGSNPVTCTAPDACHSAGTCNPATGVCGTPPNRPDGTACNDGNACTQSDSCQAGTCVGSNPVTCNAPDACHSAGTCNPATGVCGTPPNRPDGTACNDGNACTQSDSCQAGTCVGSNPVTCTAPDACHSAGTCNPRHRRLRYPAQPPRWDHLQRR